MVNDRIMWIQLKGRRPITIISCYAPTGAAEYSAKVDFYKNLSAIIKETKGKGMIFVGGDFNVRLRSDDEDGLRIGPHIFRKNDRNVMVKVQGVVENRELFQQALEQDDLVAMNTHFCKQEHRLISYKEDKTHPGGPPYNRSKYDTLDFILVTQRWKNAVQDVENDIECGLNTDHFPIIAKVHIKLKARVWERKKRWIYHKCTDPQRDELNIKLKESATNMENWDYQSFACWTLKGENALPKTEKRKTQPEVSQAVEDKLKERRELIVQGKWEEAKTKGKELKIEVRK